MPSIGPTDTGWMRAGLVSRCSAQHRWASRNAAGCCSSGRVLGVGGGGVGNRASDSVAGRQLTAANGDIALLLQSPRIMLANGDGSKALNLDQPLHGATRSDDRAQRCVSPSSRSCRGGTNGTSQRPTWPARRPCDRDRVQEEEVADFGPR